ncbi:MAG: hypothetical protein ACR2OH_03635 [Microthrixaceae bacterium]
MSSIGEMEHPSAESSARSRMGDPTLLRGAPDRAGGVDTAALARENPPPPPRVQPPAGVPAQSVPEAVPPVWSVTAAQLHGATTSGTVDPTDEPPRVRPAARRWSVVATTLAVALLAFYGLQFATAALSWYDAEIRTPGQADAMVTYAACAALVVPALLLRGRWKALPLAAAAILGAIAPVMLSRDLLGLLGIPDVWVGQAFTLHVLFPLCLGVPATIAALASPARGEHR